jgi:hypothetical protein
VSVPQSYRRWLLSLLGVKHIVPGVVRLFGMPFVFLHLFGVDYARFVMDDLEQERK